jgi:putative hydrolase
MTTSIDALVKGDYHVHSTFSDDARSTVSENLAAAAAAGLGEIRLVDHVRQSTTWVPDFLSTVAAAPTANSTCRPISVPGRTASAPS